MPRKTRICVIVGVAVMLISIVVGIGGSVAMIAMAANNLDPSDANKIPSAVGGLERAFQFSSITTCITIAVFLFTVITLMSWLLGYRRGDESAESHIE